MAINTELNQKKFETEEEVTKRYLNAVDEFIETAKKDVNVIAVVIAGSLANDVVWEKSDIDAFVVVRDQKISVPEFCLDADGIVLNMNVQERNSFVRMLEGGGFVNSFMSKAQVMYTTDDSITKMVEQNKTVGKKDAQRSAMMSACDAVCFIEKAEKWLYVKKDYTYCRYYIIKIAETLANLEIWMAGEAPGREALQRARALNPRLTERFYYYPMSRELTKGELEELLAEADDYLMAHIDYISAPVTEYLEDGEIKTLTMFYRHFRAGGHFLVHLLVYLASKGIIDQVSETIRITPKSRPNFEEIAFMFRKADQNNQEVCDAARYAIVADDYFGKNKTKISIVPYERKYHDDMLFCFLAAKDAIGSYAPDPQWSKPALRDDLLDIENNYFGRGDVFYLAIDERDRVVGMVGTQTTSPTELWLKRLFIKPELKGKGIGSKLLSAIEDYASEKGITEIHTRFAYWYREAAAFYPARGFLEIERSEHLVHMMKRLK